MSTSVNNSFITQWNDEVKQAYQQKGSKLRQAVRTVMGVTGDTYKFHKLGAITANTKARDAALTFLNPAHSVVTATLADKYAAVTLDKLDEYKTNVSMRGEFVQATANALGRDTDAILNTALLASNTNPTTLSGGLTQAKIIEALVLLNAVDADASDRFLIVSPYQIGEALNITGLTSADYQAVKALVNGDINSALGFNWISSTQLTKNALNAAGGPQANTRHCFAVHKPAIGLAVGQDVRTTIEWSPDRYGYNVVSSMSLGATVIEDTGIIEIGCVEV
jgi:hypothetical protein